MYTNKRLLEYANFLPELTIKTQEEFRLYLSIKRASLDYQGSEDKSTQQYVAQVGEKKYSIEEGFLVCETPNQRTKLLLETFFKSPTKYIRYTDI